MQYCDEHICSSCREEVALTALSLSSQLPPPTPCLLRPTYTGWAPAQIPLIFFSRYQVKSPILCWPLRRREKLGVHRFPRLSNASSSFLLHSIWKDSLTIPVYVALVSAFVLVVHIVATRRAVQRLWKRLRHQPILESDEDPAPRVPPPREATFTAEIQDRVKIHGGAVTFGFKLARLLGCIVFLSLSIYTTVLDEESRVGASLLGKKRKKKHPKDPSKFTQKELQDLAICLTSVCFSRSLLLGQPLTRPFKRHSSSCMQFYFPSLQSEINAAGARPLLVTSIFCF